MVLLDRFLSFLNQKIFPFVFHDRNKVIVNRVDQFILTSYDKNIHVRVN